jgi:diguanylate cyclase (GGDEF)-like protein
MQAPKQQQAEASPGACERDRPVDAGRRAYVRYPMVLDAVLIDASGSETPCRIKDFCMGGMLLHYLTAAESSPARFIKVNDSVVIRSTVPLAGRDTSLAFRARVARTVQDGLGLAFVEPERQALHVMQQYALQAAGDGGSLRRTAAEPFGRRAGDMIAGCNRIVQETMDTLLMQLEHKLDRHLFAWSRDTVRPDLQNDFFTASETLRAKWQLFLDVAWANFNDGLQSAQSKALSVKTREAKGLDDMPLEEMSLLNDEDLGVWLAISDATNKAEERYKEALALLEERLSVLFGIRVSHTNNPYGPALFVESFQAGLGQYRFKEAVNTACYAAFKDILIGLLADLYAKLNGVLIEYGILPDLKYSRPQHLASPRPKAEAPEPPSVSQRGVHHAAGTVPVRSKRPPAAAAPQDLFQVVQDLRALRYELAQQRRGTPAGPSAPSDDSYATAELMSVIAELQAETPVEKAGGGRETSVKSRILAALESRSGASKLNARDSNVLDVAGDLLGAMQADPLVADSVKPWLRRLELPVVKMALLDPTLFFDHAHVVRQIVNSIAQLEDYRQGQTESNRNAISVAIESLLEKAARESGEGTQTFEQIREKLDRLIKVQDKAYAENIAELVKACEESPPEPEEIGAEAADDRAGPAELQKWLLHARRLQAGDNVLLAYPGQNPQRLRLGWVGQEHSLFAFVNLRGIKEKVFRLADVATLMCRGILQPQANAADPAMDRAQYVIMQDLYQQVLHESTHDNMTGLSNRREFERVVAEALAAAKRDDLRHVLMFADIDKFSAINTNCGYAGGDQLLQSVVQILKDGLPEGACLARLGSDQFGILLQRSSLDEALALAERQIEGVANHKMEWKGGVYSVTLSMGLTPISARSGGTDDLLHAVESSCAIAKDMGGNRLQVFHAGHARLAHQHEVMKWIGRIDKMLAEETLEIRCQRIQPIDGDGSEPPHFEILVGVRDEQGVVNSPAEFIKAAEWYRRMSAVDRYVIRKTFSWLDRNPRVVDRIGGVSINLSGQSLNEDGFLDFLLKELQAVTLPRDKICFEVTETVGIANLSDAALFIERIKDEGCRFSLDDFGSGMSSYGYLKNLPVDTVKIDGMFVQNLVPGSSDYAVVKSVTEIAHFMNKKVIAEFVENEAALEVLREIGVDYVQGFMIDKPDSIERLRDTAPALAAEA